MPFLGAGDRCHDYDIVSTAGTAGAAELYLARRPSGEVCLLKLMAASGADKERLRFTQEGVALAKILHANVVQVLGAGALGDRAWLAIERFGEETLGSRLRAGERPPLDDLLGWIQQVCSGLVEVHRLGIVHRNLTPDGVVLGPGGLVKLGDFGMARLTSFGVVTTEDQQIGSTLYAAPETLAGKEEVGPRADLYALGVILYQAIAGEHPAGPGPFNAMTAVSWHIHGRARPLRERAPSLPADLETLVHQMLEKSPPMRPGSAREVHDRLRDARVSLRGPLLREVRNAAPVEGAIGFSPTQPMPASPGGDRPAVLPQPVPVAATPPLVTPPVVPPEAPTRRPVAPTVRMDAIGEARATAEPVESQARRPRPVSRWGAVIGGGVLALAAAATIGWTLWRVQGAPAPGSAPPPVSASAPPSSSPAPTASATPPRPPGGGPSRRPGSAAPRRPGPASRPGN